MDFERKSLLRDDNSIVYYYPHTETACYTSIINQSNIDDLSGYENNIYAYIADKGGTLARYYFTALGRERYSMYKTNNNAELLRVNFTN